MGIAKRIGELFARKKTNSPVETNPTNSTKVRNSVVHRKALNERNSHTKHHASSTHYLAFDLEIAKVLPEDFSQWQAHRPLGITCAATLPDGHEPILWYSRSGDGSVAGKMSQKDLERLVEYLVAATEKGWEILTWNGLGFDFDVLAEESNSWELCQILATSHTDMMFHILCAKGYPLGLDKVAKGMRLAGKTKGMSGELAPLLWQQGQYEKVLQYVAQDVRTTLEVAKAGNRERRIYWTSNRGNPQSLGLPQGWLTVWQAMALPLPDTSWMRKPLSRDDVLFWTMAPHSSARSEPPKSVNSLQEPSSEKKKEIPVEENKPVGPVDADEINAMLAQGDLYEVWNIHDSFLYPSKETPEKRVFDGCPCPICSGTPNLDPIFKWYEEPDPPL